MENRADEEHLDDSIISHNDTVPINPNQVTENKEVHHHQHVEKKSFKEYLLKD